MQINYKKRNFGLDLMRATAILMVVFAHIHWIIPEKNGFISNLMNLAGFLGVEIFFVLSGFLIGKILYNLFISQEFNFSSVFYFWIRRWFRTLPNYYLALVLNILLAIYLFKQNPDNLWAYGFFIHNFASEMPAFFTESWSLSIEEFAYIIGPLLLYLGLFIKTKHSKSKVFLAMTVSIILFFTLTKLIYSFLNVSKPMDYWNLNLKAVVVYRIDAIYYGVLAAYVSMVKPKIWKHAGLISFSFGMALILGLNLFISKSNLSIESHGLFWNLLYIPINSVAIMMVLPWLSQLSSAPKYILIPVTFLSLISYSIYLFHYSIVLQLFKFYIPTNNLGVLDIIIYIIVYLFSTILISYLVFIFYEKPMMNLRDNSFFVNRINKT